MSTELQITDELVKEFIHSNLDKISTGFIDAWEQFKESKQPKPEWEIIGFDHKPTGAIIGQLSKYWTVAISGGEDDDYEIHSVKRLSDNEVFNIGDKFIANAGCDLTIKKFEIFGSDMKVFSMEYGYWLINNIKLKPIFTTEDGIAIYKDYSGKISIVYNDFSYNYDWPLSDIIPQLNDYGNVKYFSSKEAAKEYIIDNQILFSLKEIRSNGNVEDNNPYYKKLVALAESKLK